MLPGLDSSRYCYVSDYIFPLLDLPHPVELRLSLPEGWGKGGSARNHRGTSASARVRSRREAGLQSLGGKAWNTIRRVRAGRGLPQALEIRLRPESSCCSRIHPRPPACVHSPVTREARRGMAIPKRFPTLVQLEQRGETRFQALSDITKRPYWLQSEHLLSPKPVRLEAWLVEAIFGPGGEHIPHVECVSQTLLRINRWDPEGEAEILIFGRPSYQKDVSQMIMNLAYYHRQLRAQSSGRTAAQKTETQRTPAAVPEAAAQSFPGRYPV
ncbi:KH domain-containing protein 3 [Artibeus jamaicensis]|uniref:KH domain-containing protein 3 n=1 Tax=Artibeus jamaicensis TaxID=9417 RepID=UPI00235A8955|nr:KH domain-containing protein 3 [Artibeus jamaicensis]